jgi:hypothetical protein
MSDRLWLRLGAASGIMHVVLALLGFGLGAASGGYEEDLAKAVARPVAIGVWVGAYLELLGLLCFIVFVARLWATLRRAEGDPAWLSATAFGAGLLFVVMTLVAFAAGGAATSRYGQGIDVPVARALHDLAQAAFILTWAVSAVFLGATAVVAVQMHALPRWLGWSAAVLALAQLAAVALPDSSIPMIPGFLFLFWIVAVSVVLLRRAEERSMVGARASVSSAPAAS